MISITSFHRHLIHLRFVAYLKGLHHHEKIGQFPDVGALLGLSGAAPTAVTGRPLPSEGMWEGEEEDQHQEGEEKSMQPRAAATSKGISKRQQLKAAKAAAAAAKAGSVDDSSALGVGSRQVFSNWASGIPTEELKQH